jgi:hypothetical protein
MADLYQPHNYRMQSKRMSAAAAESSTPNGYQA